MSGDSPLKFTGSIPQHYDDYLGPLLFEPYAQEVGSQIMVTPTLKVLELASGTGRLTRHLRRILPESAILTASDVSADMLTVARKNLGHLNIEWKSIDAQSIPFADNSFDLIVCYFGYMMVPDKRTAFKEAFRALRKNGQLLMATWDKLEANEASHVFRMKAKQFIGDSISESYKVPFSMHEPELIAQMLRSAGFVNIKTDRQQKYSIADSAARAAYGLVRGGSLYNEIVNRDPSLAETIAAAVENELSEKFGKAPMKARMSAFIIQAFK